MAYSSFIAHIGQATITYDKIQDVSFSPALLGRYSAGLGPVQEMALGAELGMSSNTLNVVLTGDIVDSGGVDGITITGGTGAVSGPGVEISQHVADATHSGYLSTEDWNSFSEAVSVAGVSSFNSRVGAVLSATNDYSEAQISFTDITTNNVTSTRHGYAPKSPADATQFLNGAAPPAFAAVKDSDLSTSDITTNNSSSTKHGFATKSPADATQFLNGAATPAYAAVKDSDLSTSDITTNNVSITKHGFMPKLPNDATLFLNGVGSYVTGGDVSSNTSSSVDGEIALFSSTTGKVIRRATQTGIAKVTSGVLSAATEGSDYLGPARISDTAFGVLWNADTLNTASKNAIYDQLHLFDTDDNGKINVLDQVAGITNTDASGIIQTPYTLDVDGTLAANSDTRIASQKAVKTYVDAAISGAGSVSDIAYASSWNGVTATAPSKNAIYDELHKIDTADDGTIVNAGTGFRIAGAATSGNYLRGDGTNFISASLDIPTATPAAGSIIFADIAAPASPAAAHLAIFGDSTDLRFHDKNAAGTIGTTVVADTGATNNFLTAISAAGVISKAQPTPTNVGLGNVTNDAQTKSAIVPNTAPSAGQILVGNAGGTAYAPVTVSGSGATISLASTGVMTISGVTTAVIRTIGATWDGAGAALTTGKATGYVSVPFAGTITGYSISADVGTCTIQTWRVATGTAVPTVSNSISTSGVQLTTGTHVRSTSVGDFTNTTVAVGDIFAFNLGTVAGGATQLTFEVEITQS